MLKNRAPVNMWFVRGLGVGVFEDLGLRDIGRDRVRGRERENEGSRDDFVLVYCLLPS